MSVQERVVEELVNEIMRYHELLRGLGLNVRFDVENYAFIPWPEYMKRFMTDYEVEPYLALVRALARLAPLLMQLTHSILVEGMSSAAVKLYLDENCEEYVTIYPSKQRSGLDPGTIYLLFWKPRLYIRYRKQTRRIEQVHLRHNRDWAVLSVHLENPRKIEPVIEESKKQKVLELLKRAKPYSAVLDFALLYKDVLREELRQVADLVIKLYEGK